MKRILPCLILVFHCIAALAQERSLVQTGPSLFADSFIVAKDLQERGISIGTTDTSAALSSLMTAAGIFRRNQFFHEEGKCHLAIGEIFFEAGNFNRSFGNFVRAQDVLYEENQRDWAYATLGVAKTQYHRSFYRFA
ncbi:MAG: hypothetical protein H7Y31_06280, partial [Chitinophagaceae bacterium]|nr:hypothetical protein [Chitinophagaceae bacterium]